MTTHKLYIYILCTEAFIKEGIISQQYPLLFKQKKGKKAENRWKLTKGKNFWKQIILWESEKIGERKQNKN